MATDSFDTFMRALKKGELARVYYVHGAVDVLKDDVVRDLVDAALDPGLRDFNLDQRSAASAEPDELLSLCNTLPMMADRRVVVVRDVEAWKRKTKAKAGIVAYCAKPSPETILVLVQGGDDDADAELAKHAFVVDCAPLPAERARRWTALQAKRLGVQLDEEAADHLVKVTANDLGAVRAELMKVSGLPEGTVVTRELLGDLVGVRHGETVYDWRDAVVAGDAGRAVALLGHVLAQPGMRGVTLVNTLGTTLVGIGLARAQYDRRVRGRALESARFEMLRRLRVFGLGDWKVESRLWAEAAERWSAARVKAGLAAALAADRALKGTTISDEEGILTDLTLQLAVPVAGGERAA